MTIDKIKIKIKHVRKSPEEMMNEENKKMEEQLTFIRKRYDIKINKTKTER